jgi:hypothetical protein
MALPVCELEVLDLKLRIVGYTMDPLIQDVGG